MWVSENGWGLGAGGCSAGGIHSPALRKVDSCTDQPPAPSPQPPAVFTHPTSTPRPPPNPQPFSLTPHPPPVPGPAPSHHRHPQYTGTPARMIPNVTPLSRGLVTMALTIIPTEATRKRAGVTG